MPSFLRPVRAAYDAMADAYVDHFGAGLDAGTDQAEARELLTALSRQVGNGPVLDVGCGAGRTTRFLADLGTRVAGLDLSRSMLRCAQRSHPGPAYLLGSMTALPVDDASLAGLVAWYSVIHVPPSSLTAVLAEFRRAVRPGGSVVLAFQAGDEVSHHDRPFGQDTPLDFQRYRVDEVSARLEDAGFRVDRSWTRPADPAERTPQSFLTAT